MSALIPFYCCTIPLKSIVNPGRIHQKKPPKVIFQVSCSCDFTARTHAFSSFEMRAQWFHTSPFQAAVICPHENVAQNWAEFEEHLLMKETSTSANQNASIKCFKVTVFWLWINWIFCHTSSLSHEDSGTQNAHEIYPTYGWISIQNWRVLFASFYVYY